MENEIFSNYPQFDGKGDSFCSQMPNDEKDIFVADKTEENFKLKIYTAKAICNSGCPYLVECFEWAMENGEVGVWGGSTDQERRAIKRSGAKVSLPLGPVRLRTT